MDVQKGMNEEDVQRVVSKLLQDAVNYVDSDLSPIRAKATDYYHGKNFGTEEEGRSKIILTEVRDSVIGLLPQLMRVLFASQRPVEYTPKSAAAVPMAKQATEYVFWAFMEKCGGFLETMSVLKDGLIRRLGVFKWGWEASEYAEGMTLDAVTEAQLQVLGEDEMVELHTAIPVGEDPQLGVLYRVECTVRKGEGCPWVKAVPPEEFLFSRSARSKDDALLIAHRTDMSRSDLRKLGITDEEIEEFGGRDAALTDNVEELARRGEHQLDDEAGEANEDCAYFEAYVHLDVDGDGIAELRKVIAIGPDYHVVRNEPTSHIPFSIFIPDPEPHTIDGLSWADRTMDMQWSKSHLMRAINDSLALSIFPRMAYVDGRVSVADVMNNEHGAPIRQDAPGMVQPLSQEFTGAKALPVMAYLDEVVERRTSQNAGAVGLDADALQSSTQTAVTAAVSGAQAQPELLARIFAEMTLKPLFRGLLKLFVQHQPRADMARIKGQWVEVDPRAWDADMAVAVNVALGAAPTAQKLAALANITQKQELLLQTLGPTNPLVGLVEYRNTLAEACELLGFPNVETFFKPVTQEQLDQMAQQQSQQPEQPSPEMVIAQAQMEIEQLKAQNQLQLGEMKAQNELLIQQAKLELERERMALQDDRERDKQAADIQLRIREMELKHAADLDEAQISADIERERITTQAMVQQATARSVASAAAGKPPKAPKRSVKVERDADNRIAMVHIEEGGD